MITKLTTEQIDKFPAYVDKWTKIGLDTGDCDIEKSKDAAIQAYQMAGLKEPEHFYIFDSPLSASIGVAFLKDIFSSEKNFDEFGASVRDSVRASVGASVWASVWASVGASVWASVWASVRDSVGASVGASVRDSVGASVGASVRASVGDSVRASVGASVREMRYGQHDAGWLSFYDYFNNECNLSDCEKLNPLNDIAKHCGWWSPYENIVVFQHKPDIVNLDNNSVVHCEDGPAIKYRDGFAIHAWHGVTVPSHWIEDTENVDPSEIIKVENVEQRAAGAAIIGWPRMLKVLKSKTVNDSGNSDIGQLIELTLPGLSEPGRFLKAECPRNGIIVEGVPYISDIDNLPIDTALAAQAWRIGDPQSEYTQPTKRT